MRFITNSLVGLSLLLLITFFLGLPDELDVLPSQAYIYWLGLAFAIAVISIPFVILILDRHPTASRISAARLGAVSWIIFVIIAGSFWAYWLGLLSAH